MSTFSRSDVLQLAGLARLELTDEETTQFARQLGDILTFVRDVQAVDTSSVETPATGEAHASFREDTVSPSLDRDEVLAAAPEAEAGLFKVPRVVNG